MTDPNEITLVLGASPNEKRQSYQAVRKLLSYRFKVIAWGQKEGEIDGLPILTELPIIEGVHTVSLYLSPFNQRPYYDYILGLKPKRIIFNFKTYNEEFKRKAIAAGIQVQEGCTKLMVVSEEY